MEAISQTEGYPNDIRVSSVVRVAMFAQAVCNLEADSGASTG